MQKSALLEKLTQGHVSGKLFEASHLNASNWLSAPLLPEWAKESISYLIEHEEWEELNDRFYTTLKFGTGGLRGRTIGKVTTPSEQGKGGPLGAPETPAVGTAYLNNFTIIRSTIGLYRYCLKYLNNNKRSYELPRLVIAHDVRHFSKHFSQLAASTWEALGGQAYVFDGPRSTPELSFSVRYLKTTAGIVITASHNPPHDNGYKVYFEDGGQIVSPHAEGIMEEAAAIPLNELLAFSVPSGKKIHILSTEVDEAYLEALESSILEGPCIKDEAPVIAYSSLHGTGQITLVPALKSLGVQLVEVETQASLDGRFPSVRSPNPENPDALEQVIALAREKKADAALATDPDGDRMGGAIRKMDGSYQILTGNQIGSLLAEHRIRSLKKHAWLAQEDNENAVLIKSFVTTPLQEEIAKSYGLKVINTLTGFKWIAAKLNRYEAMLKARMFEEEGIALNYDLTDLRIRAALQQRYGCFYVFGGEESYGSLFTDKIRDKDASGAAVLFAEMVAVLKREGKQVEQFLNEIYIKYGYFEESLLNLTYEGASGAKKIHEILECYRNTPPKEIAGLKVLNIKDFGTEGQYDADGEAIPLQDFFMLTLEDGSSFAVRGSGTEPKIKFYCFVKEPVQDELDLIKAKERAAKKMTKIKAALEEGAM